MSSPEKDLSVGSPMRLVLAFLLPLLLGMLFQQFYNMVDTVVVGKTLGNLALAGVGSTGSLSFLVLGLCNGICSGFAIPVAQKYGQKDLQGLRKFVGNMIWLGSFFAVVITLVTTLLCRHFLQWMHTPEDTFSYAYDYIFLIFLGIPATMLYNLTAGIIRSLGDSRTPLYFLIFSSLLNVVLDLVCILWFHMGAAGAGLATVASQLISGLLCLIYMKKHYALLRLDRASLRPQRACMLHLLSMGLPMGMQYSITAIGSILLQSAVNSLGNLAMAAVAAGNKVSLFATTPFDAIGSTAATFAGQNIGAGKPERVHRGVLASSVIGIVYSLLILGILYPWGGYMTTLFLDTSEQEAAQAILSMSHQFLVTMAVFYIPLLYVNLLRFTIQGLGYSNLAVLAGVLEMVARAVVAVWLVPRFGYNAVCFASPAAWVLADAFLFPAYYHCLKKRGYRPGRRLTSAPKTVKA